MPGGNDDTAGVNETVDQDSAPALVPNRSVIFDPQTQVVAADYDADGVYDQAWRVDGTGNGWETSNDGVNWVSDNTPSPSGGNSGPGPMDEIRMLDDYCREYYTDINL